MRFFEPGQDADLGKALLWMYQHRLMHAEVILAGRELAGRYSWQLRWVEYRDVIESLVGMCSNTSPAEV